MTNDVAAMEYQSVVLDPKDMALLGHQARMAGLGADETVALISMIEVTALNAAREAAVRATMDIVPKVLAHVQAVHVNTADRIASEISRTHRGLTTGLLNNHMPCIAAARRIREQPAQRPSN